MPNLFVTYNYSFNDLVATEKLPLPYFYLDSGFIANEVLFKKIGMVVHPYCVELYTQKVLFI